MSAVRDPFWIDLDGDFEEFARSAREAWSRMGVPDPFHSPENGFNLVAPSPQSQRTPTAPMIPRHGAWANPTDNFPGGGVNYHQSTQQWTDASAQAEASTSLALAKPNNIENKMQSESSTPAASSSGGGYDRIHNEQEKSRCLAEIREVLGIAPTEGILVTLQKIIEHLGGTIPEVEETPTPTNRAGQAKRRRAAVRACYKELQRLVGPQIDKLPCLKILNNVLERVTAPDEAQGGNGGYNPYGIFHLRKW